MHKALLWESTDGRIDCRLCPHACSIATGATGICGVRENRSGTLFATTYARVSSVAIDPIEKKPVFHFSPGSQVLSLGSVGCTMRCAHCQNWHISRAAPGDDVLEDLPADEVVGLARRNGCEGVAFTYNEPVVWIEYVLEVARAARAAGLYTVMVTNGYITRDGLDLIGDYIDVWCVDVKGPDDQTYRRLCGASSATPVLKMAIRAKERWGMHVEVVTNVVPGYNDADEALTRVARWIAESLGPSTPWHVTRFHPAHELLHVSPTSVERLVTAREIGVGQGLDHVYVGNTAVSGGEDTVCPKCRMVAIARRGFRVMAETRDGTRCGSCGADLHIVDPYGKEPRMHPAPEGRISRE